MENEKEIQRLLEQRIVGSILTLDTAEQQMQALFELGNERYINSEDYREMLHGISHLVVKEKIKVDEINLFAYLKKYGPEISKTTIGIVSVAYLGQSIKTLKVLNYKKELLNDLKKNLDNMSNAQSLTEIESVKNNFILTLTSKSFGNESVLMDYEKLEKMLFSNLSKEKTNKIDGYSFGIPDLDKVTNGIVTSKLYTIGALKKAGKTRFAIHVIRQLLKQKVTTAFLSLEVPEYEVYKMLKASSIGMEDTQLRAGNLTYISKKDIEKLKDIIFSTDELMIECNSGLNLSDILKRIRKYTQLGAKVIFIDFFQRITHDIKNKVNELE